MMEEGNLVSDDAHELIHAQLLMGRVIWSNIRFFTGDRHIHLLEWAHLLDHFVL